MRGIVTPKSWKLNTRVNFNYFMILYHYFLIPNSFLFNSRLNSVLFLFFIFFTYQMKKRRFSSFQSVVPMAICGAQGTHTQHHRTRASLRRTAHANARLRIHVHATQHIRAHARRRAHAVLNMARIDGGLGICTL